MTLDSAAIARLEPYRISITRAPSTKTVMSSLPHSTTIVRYEVMKFAGRGDGLGN